MIGKFIASLMLAGFIAGTAQADADTIESQLSLRGFGTIGLARSSSDHAEFVRDLSQPVGIKGGQWSGRIDSILGLQANWQATPEIELVGQVVSRLHYDRSHNPEVMWAFVKWEPDPRISLRGGRIGADFMMLADSRLVGYSYLPVRPPVDYFGPLFFSHFDGVDISATSQLGNGLLRAKLFTGSTHQKSAGALGVWDTSGSPVKGIVLDFASGAWQFRMNAAQIKFAADMNLSVISVPLQNAANFGVAGAGLAADSLRTKGTVTRFLSFGVVFDQGPFQFQGMLNHIKNESSLYKDSYAGYLLAGYRVGSFTPFIGISRWLTQPQEHLPVVANPVLNFHYLNTIDGSHVDRSTLTIGTRWDINTNTALKFQWDVIRTSANTEFSLRNVDSAWNGKADVLSVTLDFVF
jgi:hypothetical protein